MKRKLALGLCVGMLTLSLVGCSSSNEGDKETSNETPAVTEAFTGDKTVELPSGKEGKDTLITTVTFEDGKPVDVNIDVKGEDGKMKSDLVAAGEYVMANETAPWTEQVDALEAFIKENDFDLSKVTLTNEEGNTDAVSGVTIKVGEYVEGVQKALDEVK
ncbi:MAG: hypothetical protein ACRC92_09960 [Peptostreptococcaceae bacterium]